MSYLDLREVQNVTAGQQELLNFVFKLVELAVLALVRYFLNWEVIYRLWNKSISWSAGKIASLLVKI